jgi:hypothetical protein
MLTRKGGQSPRRNGRPNLRLGRSSPSFAQRGSDTVTLTPREAGGNETNEKNALMFLFSVGIHHRILVIVTDKGDNGIHGYPPGDGREEREDRRGFDTPTVVSKMGPASTGGQLIIRLRSKLCCGFYQWLCLALAFGVWLLPLAVQHCGHGP